MELGWTSGRLGVGAREYRVVSACARMKVALMGRSLRGRYSGVVRYTHELVAALAPRLGSDLTVFVTRAADGIEGIGVRLLRAPFNTPNEYARAFWEQVVVPWDVARMRPDVYHSPNYILPLAVHCPTVVTIHDLAFLDASVHRLRSHLYLSALSRIAVHKANRVICVSAYTRDQLVRHYPRAAGRTRVIGEGVAPRFRPQPRAAVDRFLERYGLRRPYVLFLGTIEPRKNLPRLIAAFEQAVRMTGTPHHLLIGGASGWKTSPVARAYEDSPLRDRIHLLGYLADQDLPAALTGADVFAYPSLQEGFGLPPLEAMACGSAVLTSTTTSLPEVVGEAALKVDPHDECAMAEGLALLLMSRAEREHLAAAGRERADEFRWDKVAEQTLAVYREAAG
jgi:glycosyltransferase involved in cell wall biosynthesis